MFKKITIVIARGRNRTASLALEKQSEGNIFKVLCVQEYGQIVYI